MNHDEMRASLIRLQNQKLYGTALGFLLFAAAKILRHPPKLVLIAGMVAILVWQFVAWRRVVALRRALGLRWGQRA